jgi:hypothetical protein
MLQRGVRMGTTPIQSPNQEVGKSSPKANVKSDLLSLTPPWNLMPTIPANAELLKDSRKLLLRLAKDGDDIATWLRMHTGSTVTVAIPHLGLAWSPTLSYRRTQRYFYVRVPANLRRYLLPFWQAGLRIPVIIMVPPVALATRVPGVMENEQQ